MCDENGAISVTHPCDINPTPPAPRHKRVETKAPRSARAGPPRRDRGIRRETLCFQAYGRSQPLDMLRPMHDLSYRKELDGLRAIAVVSVILFHVGFPSMPGGYVGVECVLCAVGLSDLRADLYPAGRRALQRDRVLCPADPASSRPPILPVFWPPRWWRRCCSCGRI